MNTDNAMDIRGLLDRVNLVIEAKKGKTQTKSGVGYLQLAALYLENIVRAKEDGKHFVVHSTQMPTEIFYAMDVVPLFNELYSVVMSIVGDVQDFLRVSAAHGMPLEVCSFYRCLDGMVESGFLPKPDFVCYSSSVCDNTPKGIENVGKTLKVPGYGMDRPYTITSPQSLAYWKKEHEGLIAFLEEQTGQKMDYDRLKEAVRLSYRATQLCLEIDALCKKTPCPMPAEAAFGPLMAVRQFAGTPEAVAYLEQLRDELAERAAKGIGAVAEERFRYVFAVSCPYFDMGLMPLMEQKYGAVMVADYLQRWRGKAEWLVDPDDPVGNLAYKVSFHHANTVHGPAEDYVEQVVQLAREYRTDGAIFFNNSGCRHAAGLGRSIKDELEQQFGIPMVTIYCDILDKTVTSRDEVVSKLDVFFELIENSKSYQARRKAA